MQSGEGGSGLEVEQRLLGIEIKQSVKTSTLRIDRGSGCYRMLYKMRRNVMTLMHYQQTVASSALTKILIYLFFYLCCLAEFVFIWKYLDKNLQLICFKGNIAP